MEVNLQKADEAIDEILEAIGVERTPEVEEQLTVLLACLKLYAIRGKDYGNVWQQYGALSNLVRAATKCDRLMEMWWHQKRFGDTSLFHKDRLDDAFDGINYLTFFIRCARAGNVTGSPRTRLELLEPDLYGI